MDKVEGGEIDPQEVFSKIFGGGKLVLSVNSEESEYEADISQRRSTITLAKSRL